MFAHTFPPTQLRGIFAFRAEIESLFRKIREGNFRSEYSFSRNGVPLNFLPSRPEAQPRFSRTKFSNQIRFISLVSSRNYL